MLRVNFFTCLFSHRHMCSIAGIPCLSLRREEKGKDRVKATPLRYDIMTCKQEFLVLENGESLLPCRVAASFPFRDPSLVFSARFLMSANSFSNKRFLYLLAVCLSSVFSCFREFAIRRAMAVRAISDSRPLLFACERARFRERQGGARRAVPDCLPVYFRNVRDWLRGVSDLSRSRFRRSAVPRTCLPTRFGGSLSPLTVKGNGYKFTDALFNHVATLTQRSNNRLPPKTRYKLVCSALHVVRED